MEHLQSFDGGTYGTSCLTGELRAACAYRYKKPVLGNDGSLIGYSDWILSTSKDYLEWWPHEALYAAPNAIASPLEPPVGPRAPRHPTLAECEAAGRGPENYPGKPFEVGGLPATKEERARFEAYMRGHSWGVGNYVDAEDCYNTMFVRCLFGIWRDRGALPTVWPNAY